jgi:cbb3-type cytochrome oxidase subunit 3
MAKMRDETIMAAVLTVAFAMLLLAVVFWYLTAISEV